MRIPEPAENSPTWPVVLAFAKLMEWKLAQNRHKGDRPTWLADWPKDLSDRIFDEYVELRAALRGVRGKSGPENQEAVALECADIANFAMMTADSATFGLELAKDPEIDSRKSESGMRKQLIKLVSGL